MANRTFQLDDIHCDGCERAIRNALTRLEGVSEVRPDHATNRVGVDFDEQRVTEEAITERLDLAGYPVVDWS